MRLLWWGTSRVLLTALALSLAACSWKKKETDVQGESVRVQIPFAVDGSYRLEIVELFSLQDLTTLKGLAAQFLMDPRSTNGHLSGRSPQLQYIRDRDGVIVAKDDLSLQLLTVYAHIEKLKALEEKSGLAGVLSYPRKVAVNIHYKPMPGEIPGNNALYSGLYDAILVEPYSLNELPLMANAGALAHEHFHALFQKLVIEPSKDLYPDPSQPSIHDEEQVYQRMGLVPSGEISGSEAFVKSAKPRDLYHATLLRGINEGFADVWGWIYSGDTGFVGRSLPSEKLRREMNAPPGLLAQPSDIMAAVNAGLPMGELVKISYRYGAQLAQTIRGFASLYAQDQSLPLDQVRLRLAPVLIKTLPEIQKQFTSLKEDELFTLSSAVRIFAEQVQDLNERQCNYFGKLMQSNSGVSPLDTINPDKDRLVRKCRALKPKQDS